MTALFEVEGLEAGYGSAQVLEGVNLSMDVEATVVIGRNGMGKTTLCNTIMGLNPTRGGQVRIQGRDITGLPAQQVARAGIAYVPQGRRLFPSLSVDEHFAMLEKGARGKPWTPERVYELFPRLGERKQNGGAELSGGEQQMVAIGRALLLNTPLILMDEPSEGLAPTIVDILIEAIRKLVDEGIGVLIVEQNLGAATAIAERQLVMIAGEIAAETTATELLNDPDAQRRYLGVDT